MERAALVLRILLIAIALGLWLPGSLWAMDAGVVRIESQVGGKTRFGSGFVVRTEGEAAYLLTAAHVVEGDPKPKVYFHTRPHRPATAKVLAVEGGDPRGLALLLVDSGLPDGVEVLPAAAGSGRDLKRGETVVALGIPAGLRTWAVIPGNLVAWRNRNILFSGDIDEGNSGGPLVKGQSVVGLVMGISRGFGMAVPVVSLTLFLESNAVVWAAGAKPETRTVKAATKEKRVPSPKPKALEAGETFRDCDQCPEMLVIPAGSFQMGSPEGEAGRSGDEGPVHEVRISKPFALGRREVTVGEYRAFVEASGYRTEAEKGDGCTVWDGAKWHKNTKRNWRSPGFEQTADRPVVCVSWNDATAYVDWLSKKTGKTYRLPSETEWEYAARAGTTTARFWGDDSDLACTYANVADKSLKARYSDWPWPIHDCDDGFVHTSPAGSFQANGFRLDDMLGNAWEWTMDCWNGSYAGAPADGSAWTGGDCNTRVFRGGSWNFDPDLVRSANRGWYIVEIRFFNLGFRPARTL